MGEGSRYGIFNEGHFIVTSDEGLGLIRYRMSGKTFTVSDVTLYEPVKSDAAKF